MSYVPSKLRKKFDWLFGRAEGALLPPAVLGAFGAHLDPDGARLALRACADDLAIVGEERRLTALLEATGGSSARARYVEAYGVCGVRRFEAGGGLARVYQLAVETLPRHVSNVYVVLEAGSALMLDCGSGLPTSRRDLALGFAVARAMFDEPALHIESLDACVVSHAHADHFGGARDLKRSSRAELSVHELDAPAIALFDQHLTRASRDIDVYWQRAGVPAARRATLREMYLMGKSLFHAQALDRTLRDGDAVGPGYPVHHVPGHCAGLVCVQVHDVLLTSDHVLARISPHQFPEAIAPFAGLEHYLRSLAKIRALEGVALALGGHEEPIVDLRARIDEIELFHQDRLEQVRALCESPRTIDEVSASMFGEQEGYGAILAIDEAGAHVEHLHRLGRLREVAGRGGPGEPAVTYVAS